MRYVTYVVFTLSVYAAASDKRVGIYSFVFEEGEEEETN